MKVIIAVLLFATVAFGRYHHTRRDLKSDFLEASRKAVKAVHQEFFADAPCTEADALSLHDAHLRFKLGKMQEKCEEGIADDFTERGVSRHSRRDGEKIMKHFKKLFKHFSKDTCLKLSDSCTPEAIMSGMKILHENHEKVKEIVEGVFSAYPELVKIHDVVKGAIEEAGAEVKAQYFPDTLCSDEALFKIGHVVKHVLVKGKKHRPAKGPSSEAINRFITKFREEADIECSVEEIRKVGEAIFKNHRAIMKIFKKTIKQHMDENGIKPPNCEDIKAASLQCSNKREFELEFFETREQEQSEYDLYKSVSQRYMAEQARQLISSAYLFQ